MHRAPDAYFCGGIFAPAHGTAQPQPAINTTLQVPPLWSESGRIDSNFAHACIFDARGRP
jgi:hypothetical protein